MKFAYSYLSILLIGTLLYLPTYAQAAENQNLLLLGNISPSKSLYCDISSPNEWTPVIVSNLNPLIGPQSFRRNWNAWFRSKISKLRERTESSNFSPQLRERLNTLRALHRATKRCLREELSVEDFPAPDLSPTPTSTPSATPTSTPTPTPSSELGEQCSQVSQYGITWTFDREYPCGQFIGGDWWVTGPVTIVSVSPDWDGSRHGTMINPVTTTQQGYHVGGYTFNGSLRASFPRTVPNESSVVSTRGLEQCATGGAHECLLDSAVLTVLSAPPSFDSFRPPYFGTSKPLFTAAEVNYGILPRLPIPPVPLPNVSDTAVRPWLDHGPKGNEGGRCHPRNNMAPYSRDSSVQLSQLAVMTMLDTPQQTEYANRIIQLGIDLYYVHLANGDGFRAYGGFGNGRKFPILFAGLLLDNENLKHPQLMVPSLPYEFKFGEDGHTYYGQPTAEYPSGKPLWGRNCESDGYSPPFYGNHDCRDSNGLIEAEEMPNGGSYRTCCTSHTWVGQILAAQLLDLKTLWNHSATFDYVDRWTSEPSSWVNSSLPFYRDIYGFGGNGAGFMQYMWEQYRH